ncbi:beta-propeller fold lactonase family protein [Pandoraea pulmonicola]|uniref:6-phosphogluconolactonase n=1 Tax=Pandoraea pulmonicola TaxID=93221 RepID=A0AAJ4Z859_PANPU|nr:beta-propeller fold lactonase family protein [Pandoraea pulmonicola]SUA88586.1 6-phosphogluconolactonase [Pandoraea pulmonicola]
MKKFAYFLGYGVVYPYSVQPDGSLSSLGRPVPSTDAVDIACANASAFQRGGNYIFLANQSNNVTVSMGAISIYHVNDDGSLTPNIQHYTNGVQSEPSYIVGFYTGSNTYDIYIDNYIQADEQNPLTEQIPGFRFSPPDTVRPWNKKVNGLPDSVVGDVADLELVSTPGADPSYQAQILFALYRNTPANKTQIVALETSAFGLSYLGSGEVVGTGQGYALAANLKFAYVIFGTTPTNAPTPLQVAGFKLDGSGRQFTPLGNVAQLNGSGTACAISPNGKYLFIGVTGDMLDDQGANVVASYKIGSDGFLSKSDQKPCGSIGLKISALTVDPSGKYLYAMSEYEGNVYVYEVNDDDGSLTPKPSITVDNGNGAGLFGMVIIDV